uniref:Uncharacterized protein n=1 Tax=Panagrolaimus sp. JU765 TaxID=591449 RepID=A0AC34RIU7_9BILA
MPVKGIARCFPQLVTRGNNNQFSSTIGECPRLVGGLCLERCNRDSDCPIQMKCCNNGCGTECVLPVSVAPIMSTLPIQPIGPASHTRKNTPIGNELGFTPEITPQLSHRTEKIGHCPNKAALRDNRCEVQCNRDADCHGVTKCCDSNCGRICAAPERATTCVHLLSAVERLPQKRLANDFIPLCSPLDGSFLPIQCDSTHCWCVHITDGKEMYGTKVSTDKKAELHCEGLLNPCLNGLPMTLPTGVTALCTQTSQCGNEFWCHQIGYNGLGYCCPLPESASRPGSCEARVPRHQKNCAAECRSDVDCPSTSKCCFDGCGLSCMNVQFAPNPFQHRPESKLGIVRIDSLKHNKEILSPLLAECPDLPKNGGTQSCNTECKTDSDCRGLRRCCAVGCSRICVYPQKTTGCLHEAISHELYSIRHAPRCTPAGNYDEVQCDDERCFCVDQLSGVEIPNTWVPTGNQPNCKAIRSTGCPALNCPSSCRFGHRVDANGCSTCECKNPCAEVHCHQGQIASSVSEPSQVVPNLPIAPIKATVTSSNKIGLCPGFVSLSNCQNVGNVCQTDRDCEGIKKCCSDGCARKCVYAQKTTPCLHMKAAFEKLGLSIVLQCTNGGEFEEIQCDNTYCYCVDRFGKETVGTRVSKGLRPDCKARRLCEDKNCNGKLNCPFGYMKDSNGCNTCECLNPCQNVQCPENGQICVPHSVDCLNGVCPQVRVPKCIINVCSDYPLYQESTLEPVACRDHSDCGRANAHCKIFKDSGGYCCIGAPPASHAGSCPNADRVTAANNEEECQISCKEDNDCQENEKCCHVGGCSLTCVAAGTDSAAASFKKKGLKIGECPVVDDLGSRVCGNARANICQDDDDCPSVQKCCFDGCAKSCQDAEVNTECLHAKAAADGFKRAKIAGVFEPRCDDDGAYDKVQRHRGMSWCVDSHGKELPGTRTSRKDPDCIRPRSCPVMSCTKHCLFGPEMNDHGCPTCECKNPCLNLQCPLNHVCRLVSIQCFLNSCLPVPKCILNACPRGEPLERVDNGQLAECDDLQGRKCPQGWFCHKFGMGSIGYCCPGNVPCKSPCEDMKCAKETDICVLKSVSCLGQPCPSVAICRSNPCGENTDPLKDVNSRTVTCSKNEDCGQGSCQPLLGERNFGVCCPTDVNSQVFVTSSKIGDCPVVGLDKRGPECAKECEADGECSGTRKCCSYGCNKICAAPVNATNCIHMASALETLQERGIRVQIPRPQCDSHSGMYTSTQCDDDSCWCVDTVTGIEFHGTRSAGRSPNVCTARRTCSIQCDDRQNVCPFGLEINSQGCPKTSNCRCRNPCDQVECGVNEVCLLRPIEDCRDQMCLSVPTCETNVCINRQKPAVEPRTYTQFTCLEDRSQVCPTGFYCTNYDIHRRGICCPGQEPILAQHTSVTLCPHGDAFSSASDGSPTECSVSNQGSCPSTHYCLSKPNHPRGICCVTKRYVCNLEKDAGPCNAKIPRFFYNEETQKCESFTYGGCSGNLNNFATEDECENFCVGTGVDILNTAFSDDDANVQAMDVYNMGFSLTGPLLREKHSQEINNAFLNYLTKNFNVDESEIRDLYIKDDNTVRFTIYSANAKEKASNISNAVSNGDLKFTYKNDVYKAQPQTWFSHQVEQRNDSIFESKFFYWTLLGICVVFALIILLSLCCAFAFLRKKRVNDSSSSYRASPSPYGQISAYTTHENHATSPQLVHLINIQRRKAKKQGDPANDAVKMRADAVGGGNLLTPLPSIASVDSRSISGSHPQNGRRTSRTTLYY